VQPARDSRSSFVSVPISAANRSDAGSPYNEGVPACWDRR
jgi:hypothetical protein